MSLPYEGVASAKLNRGESRFKDMPMSRLYWLLTALVAYACDKDVPHVDDPFNIVVNGVSMSSADFLNKYCIEKEVEPTCLKVRHAVRTSIRGRGQRFSEDNSIPK